MGAQSKWGRHWRESGEHAGQGRPGWQGEPAAGAQDPKVQVLSGSRPRPPERRNQLHVTQWKVTLSLPAPPGRGWAGPCLSSVPSPSTPYGGGPAPKCWLRPGGCEHPHCSRLAHTHQPWQWAWLEWLTPPLVMPSPRTWSSSHPPRPPLPTGSATHTECLHQPRPVCSALL